jgi:hypothetical protein
MVNIQYPHTLTSTVTGAATKDSNGDWTPGTATSTTLQCRAESSSGYGYLISADGVRLDYSWKVYMPKSDVVLFTGSSVTVTDGETVLCNDTIKRYEKGFFNCTAWL